MLERNKLAIWAFLNKHANTYGLWILRTINAFIYLTIVLYLFEALTGIDMVTVIVFLGTFVSAFCKSEKNLILILARKIVSLDWGLSFFLFLGLTFYMWNVRHGYYGYIKSKLGLLN